MADADILDFVDKVSQIMPVITREFFKHQTEQFYKMKITLPQFAILQTLHKQGQSRMTDLARLLNVTTAAMTGIADRLVRDGYARRNRDPEDRRIVKISLTNKGSKIVKSLIEKQREMMIRIFGVISQAEREEYLKILIRVRDGLKARER